MRSEEESLGIATVEARDLRTAATELERALQRLLISSADLDAVATYAQDVSALGAHLARRVAALGPGFRRERAR